MERSAALVARLAVDAGYEVVLSNSRGPDTSLSWWIGSDPGRCGHSVSEAAAVGDMVVVTVPLRAYREVPIESLRGKVVNPDTNNDHPDRDGHMAELDDESTTTSELLQKHLPQSPRS